MSIQSLNNSGQASATNATSAALTGANSALTEQQAMDAFVQALTQVVSFQGQNGLPSLPGIFAKAAAQQTNAAQQPSQSQSNDQPQQQNDSGPTIVQSGQNGPTQSQTTQSSSSAQTKKSAANAANDQSQSTNASSSDQSTNTVNPTSDQTVMAVVAAQIVQAPQQVQQTQTVTTGTTDVGTQTTGPILQEAANAGPTGPTGAVQQAGPQTGPKTTVASGPTDATAGQKQSASQDDTWSILQGSASATAVKGPTVQTASKGNQAALKDQQANDLAASLDGTGANLAIKVAVNANANAKTNAADQQSADAAATQAALLVAADPLASNSNNPSLTKDDGSQADAGQTAQLTGDAKPTAADALTQSAETFSAVLAAQIETEQPEAAPPPTQQNITGVTGVSGTQATQKTQAAQAPQAPTSPRTAQQAQVMDQVSVQISKQAKDGVDSIKVQLRPEELGRIEIKLEVSKDGSVQATVTAENKDTLAMLQKDSAGLAKALSDAGLSTDSGSMNFNLRGEGQQQFAGDANSQNGNNGSNGGGNGRAPWLAAAGNDDVDVSAQPSQSSLSAVDIRV